MKFISHSPKETAIFAKKYIDGIIGTRGVSSKGLILGLYGNLGSGKTAFAQGIAAALGIEETVTSPTFVIEKIYPLKHSLSTADSQSSPQSYTQNLNSFTDFTHLIHIDAYRLENEAEMKHLGWDEITANPGNLIIVEWPERIAKLLPADHVRVGFTFVDEMTREIETTEEAEKTDGKVVQ